jgi:hypothetical protein
MVARAGQGENGHPEGRVSPWQRRRYSPAGGKVVTGRSPSFSRQKL